VTPSDTQWHAVIPSHFPPPSVWRLSLVICTS